jgi:hypothetical protein
MCPIFPLAISMTGQKPVRNAAVSFFSMTEIAQRDVDSTVILNLV